MNILKYITNKKYRFFYKKANDVQYAIWDLDFKLSKTRQIREGVRQDRDRAIEQKNNLASQENKTEQMKKDLETYEENVARYERQMKMLDDEVVGGTPTEHSPDGVGILERIASYAELREMFKNYLKTL